MFQKKTKKFLKLRFENRFLNNVFHVDLNICICTAAVTQYRIYIDIDGCDIDGYDIDEYDIDGYDIDDYGIDGYGIDDYDIDD